MNKTKDFRNARYKTGQTSVISQEFQLKKSDLMSKAREFNFFTKGQKFDPSAPSLCPGDSGGPVYNLDGEIVGVNAQYTFKPKDPSGVSYTNLHTKISAVADWLQNIISENP